MAQDSQLFDRIVAALTGNIYVPPLQQAEDPTLSDWEITAEKRKRDEAIRRYKLGLDPIVSDSPQVEPSSLVSEPLVGRTPKPGDIKVDPLERYSRPSPGVPSGRATDYISLEEQAQAVQPDENGYPYTYDPKEYLRNYADSLDPNKLARIRAEAAGKARRGSLEGGQATGEDFLRSAFGGRGSLSQQKMSPELSQRLAARDEWAAGQDIRDAQWERDLARQRRDEPAKAAATEQLINLKNQMQKEKELEFQQSIASSFVNSSGKIPRDKAAVLLQAGIPITGYAIGSDPADIDRSLAYEIETAQKMLSGVNPLEAVGNPNAKKTVDLAQLTIILGQQMREKIKKGMDPDEAAKEFRDQLTQRAAQLGLESAQNFYLAQSGPQQVITGE